jgi:cytochrome c551/c552
MMIDQKLYAAAVMFSVTLLAGIGCETPKTNSEVHMGSASGAATEMMIATTKGEGAVHNEALELDGPTAAGVLDKYREGEKYDRQIDSRNESGIVKVSENN